MKRRALWELAVITSAEAEEAVAGLLEQHFSSPPLINIDVRTQRHRVSVYLPWTRAQMEAKRPAVKSGLERIASFGLRVTPARVLLKRIHHQNWAESWKRSVKPISIRGRLLIKPSWSKLKARPAQQVIILDPGLSFGTGHHATTAYCLRQIVDCRTSGQRQSFLDTGTGSGLLAIAAAKLGYSPVHALDNDPQAIQVALANARRNGVQRQIRFAWQDLTDISSSREQCYDLICANLVDTLLLRERRRLSRLLAPRGKLVLAGILAHQFPAVQKAYRAEGLRLVHTRAQNPWQSGAFARLHNESSVGLR